MDSDTGTTRPDLERRLGNYELQARACRMAARGRLGRWPAYAAAVGSSLALTTAAEADIIYSGPKNLFVSASVHTTGVAPGGSIHTRAHTVLPISDGAHGGRIGVSVGLFNRTPRFYRGAYGGVLHPSQTAVFVNAAVIPFGGVAPPVIEGSLRRFASGAKISSRLASVGSLGFLFRSSTVLRVPSQIGTWPPSQPGFAGFEFRTGKGGIDVGWLRLEWFPKLIMHLDSVTPEMRQTGITIELLDAAYNNTPGSPILAGELPAAAVPEPGTLGLMLLATGAAGVAAWRRLLQAHGDSPPQGAGPPPKE